MRIRSLIVGVVLGSSTLIACPQSKPKTEQESQQPSTEKAAEGRSWPKAQADEAKRRVDAASKAAQERLDRINELTK